MVYVYRLNENTHCLELETTKHKVLSFSDNVFVSQIRDDEAAFEYFRHVLDQRSRKAIDELNEAENAIALFERNYKVSGVVVSPGGEVEE